MNFITKYNIIGFHFCLCEINAKREVPGTMGVQRGGGFYSGEGSGISSVKVVSEIGLGEPAV